MKSLIQQIIDRAYVHLLNWISNRDIFKNIIYKRYQFELFVLDMYSEFIDRCIYDYNGEYYTKIPITLVDIVNKLNSYDIDKISRFNVINKVFEFGTKDMSPIFDELGDHVYEYVDNNKEYIEENLTKDRKTIYDYIYECISDNICNDAYHDIWYDAYHLLNFKQKADDILSHIDTYTDDELENGLFELSKSFIWKYNKIATKIVIAKYDDKRFDRLPEVISNKNRLNEIREYIKEIRHENH